MRRTRQQADGAEWRLCSTIDKLDEFDHYERSILPILRRAVAEKWPTRRIRKELASFSQALVVQKGLAGNMGAIKDVLDRDEGFPRRRINRTRESVGMTRAQLVELAYQRLVAAGLSSNAIAITATTNEGSNQADEESLDSMSTSQIRAKKA